jgi:hypothetical protein
MLAIGLWDRREAREPIAVGDGDKEAHKEIVNNGANSMPIRGQNGGRFWWRTNAKKAMSF